MIIAGLAAAALAQDIDWHAVGDETVEILANYLRVDTVNPPGNETLGARFLADLLATDGIKSEIVEFAPGRGNLIARLHGSGDEAPLCLLSHIDVVTAEAAQWRADRPPLGGVIADGYVWGRGALDMKGMGVLELQVLRLLRRHAVPLRRDVVLIAVADEEVNNLGMKFIVEEHWDRIGCSHLINEGGIGLIDMFFDDQTVFPISVGEKGLLWGHLVASGAPGHGSTPLPDESPERLHSAVESLSRRRVRPRFHESLYQTLANVGEHRGGLTGTILQSPALVRLLLRRRLMKNPLTRAAITDTVHVTGYGGAKQPNVVPVDSWANVDARLLPGTSPDAMEARILDAIRVPEVRFERSHAEFAAVTTWDDPLYTAIATRAVKGMPEAVAGPIVSVGFTDSIYVRPLGVRAYGFVPFAVTLEDATGMHGNNERVSIDNVHRGVRVLFDIVTDVAGEHPNE
ncbi:MAG: acetylornithine deacetylase/succinyl-diaminopimelate desuccinylase-like protein [Myxococcota bacterium]|jgi:acetylornithine deacetylase/succinyl-diaminopimelate desuccinylase-like protein